MNIDDPKLTAHMLGELDPVERADIERLLRGNPAVAAECEAMREFAGQVRRRLDAEPQPGLDAARRRELMRMVSAGTQRKVVVPFSRTAMAGALAASVLAGVGLALLFPALSRMTTSRVTAESRHGKRGALAMNDGSEVRVGLMAEAAMETAPEMMPFVVAAGDELALNGNEGSAVSPTMPGRWEDSAGLQLEMWHFNPQPGNALFNLALLANHPVSTANPAPLSAPQKLASVSGANANRGTSVRQKIASAPTRMAADSWASPDARSGGFSQVAEVPLADVPIAAGARSLEKLGTALKSKALPPGDAVRIAELVNFFHYDYPLPEAGAPVSVSMEVAACPWSSAHRLLRVGLRARDEAAISADVKIQIEFNPAQAGAYRLIGCEDGGTAIGSGNSVTLLYEVVPASAAHSPRGSESLKYQPASKPSRSAAFDELLTLKFSQNAPAFTAGAVREFPLKDSGHSLAQSTRDFRFAAAAAGCGMLLRDSPHRGGATWALIKRLAVEGKGDDREGSRAEFIAAVERERALAR